MNPMVVRRLADNAADKTCVLQLPQHHAGGGAVEPQELGDGDLIDAGLMPKHEHNAVLPVGDAECAGLLQEHRHGNLVRAADHEAGPAVELIERRLRQFGLTDMRKTRPRFRGDERSK